MVDYSIVHIIERFVFSRTPEKLRSRSTWTSPIRPASRVCSPSLDAKEVLVEDLRTDQNIEVEILSLADLFSPAVLPYGAAY